MPEANDPMAINQFFMDAFIQGKLNDNKDKNFVKRILNRDKYGSIKNKDGTHSTHLMAWSEVDGKYIAYPEIVMKNKKLKKLSSDKAIDYALENNEYISFDTPEEADLFTKNYKRVWK